MAQFAPNILDRIEGLGAMPPTQIEATKFTGLIIITLLQWNLKQRLVT